MSSSREDRFCLLYEWTRPPIIAYALRRTASREDAADVVAETFEIAWRRLDVIPAGEAGLLWLYVTARYVLANHGRRLRRRDDMTARLADELRGVSLRVEAPDEESLVMQSCLNSLSPDERELLMLAGWEGLNAAELGRVLGCSPTAARIRLHRARGRLKAEMAKGEEGAERAEVPEPGKQPGASGHVRDGTTKESCTPEEVFEQ
jgi:RNA polymerase sigma factor (sigma-70 family)